MCAPSPLLVAEGLLSCAELSVEYASQTNEKCLLCPEAKNINVHISILFVEVEIGVPQLRVEF